MTAGPATEAWSPVCASADLEEGGDGRRFDLLRGERREAAFVVRVDGLPRAYLNRCAHVPVELDWIPGRFLDDSGLVIICTVHGATYDASDGACIGGPCDGRGLQALDCREADGTVWVRGPLAPPEAPPR
jgi:nitrite reductase/ring-hydroxylating ferredoxin subunit